MANYKNQTGISFIIAEKEDGTYDVNMGSNADLPQDGLPVKFYTGIMQAVCDYVDYVEEHNTKKTCSCSDQELTTDRMLAIIKKISQIKKELNKASNQIASYEIGLQMGKLIDELVSLYAEMEQNHK